MIDVAASGHYTGDCRDLLAQLPEGCVQTCVTSPPYWGLRDYGCDGQIGLEPTPDAYVAALVEVFRGVRRALRNDGTLWLNLGDSYATFAGRVGTAPGGGEQGAKWRGDGMPKVNGRGEPMRTRAERDPKHAGKHTAIGPMTQPNRMPIEGLKPKDLVGIPWLVAFALRQPWIDWQIKTEAMRAWVAGIVDGDGCITILQTKSSHSESLSFPPVVQVKMCDREPLDRLVEVAGSKLGDPQMPPSHIAANQREHWQWKLVSERAAKVIAEIYPFLTCKRKQAIVAWNHQSFRSARGNQERRAGDLEKEQFCKELINKLNQRESVDLPSWMTEPKVIAEPGWYLRQDLIWSKPNPMPESVTDRCTKAHEYLFLLSKSGSYYFDDEAIAEPATGDHHRNVRDPETSAVPNASPHRGLRNQAIGSTTRNRRSVWTVASQPYDGAHFATFPPKLIEPCILAGSRPGDLVLDPFFGSGTTGAVAEKHGRRWIGFDLNPEYAALAKERTAQRSLPLAEAG